MNRIMKETNTPWIGQIPDDWQVCRFKDLAYSKKEVAGNKAENYERLALTLKGVIKRSKEDDKGLQPSDFYTYQILNSGDFIFKMIDLQNVSTSRVGLSPFTGLVSPAYVRFIPKDGINKEFYYFYLMSLYYQKVFNNIAGDGVRSALNAGDLGLIECPIPSKEEQIEIVKTIKDKEEKINALIANEEKQIEKLKAYKQALISEVVTKGLDPNVPMKDSGVKWIGYVPKGWNILYLKQISIIKTGSTPPTSISEYFDGEINWYTPSDFRSSKTISSERKLTNKAIVDLNINLFPKHTTLIVGIGGTAGKISIIENAGYSNQQITAILSKKDIDKKYLYYCLTAASKYLKDNAMYTTLPIINNEYLKNFKVCVPELNEQSEISKFLEEKCLVIDSIIECHNFRIKSFKEYRQSIIYEYVTGKREV